MWLYRGGTRNWAELLTAPDIEHFEHRLDAQQDVLHRLQSMNMVALEPGKVYFVGLVEDSGRWYVATTAALIRVDGDELEFPRRDIDWLTGQLSDRPTVEELSEFVRAASQ